MIGLTLGSYFALHFLRNTLMIFGLFLMIILAVDLVELMRSVPAGLENVAGKVLQIAVLRAPSFTQHIVPFSVLFGAALSLLLLNRRLELVVVRASGISVWQFLLPYAFVSLLLGLGASLVYDPLSLTALKASRAMEANLYGRVRGNFSNRSSNFWVRLSQKDGEAIVRAGLAQDSGTVLSDVTVYRFDKSGASIERIDAKKAQFLTDRTGSAYYELSDVTTVVPGSVAVKTASRKLSAQITAAELQINTTSPESINFWSLGTQAERAQIAGRNHLQFLTRQQSLLAQPLLFFAMVLLAACVSLRFTRFGQSGTLILGGILAGFVLYVASVIVLTFGSNGFVSPALAAWSPAFVASLIGITVLLHQEDG